MIGIGINIWNNSSVAGYICTRNITTPIDVTDTIQSYETACSSTAIEIDSIAAGNGIVVVNGTWRLSGYLLSPIDTTVTVNVNENVYSSGAIEIDSVAPGIGIVIINGTWRLI